MARLASVLPDDYHEQLAREAEEDIVAWHPIANDPHAINPEDWRSDHSSRAYQGRPHLWGAWWGGQRGCLREGCNISVRRADSGMWLVTDSHGTHRRDVIGPCWRRR